MKKILTFEGDQALSEELKQKFRPYGCIMEIVDDGNEGLQKAKSDRPDLILLTIELPKMNGFSICNKLKKNPELKPIPLIIMSAEATEDTFQQHAKLRTRAEDYLRKPFEFSQLLEKVGNLIQLDAPQSAEQDGLMGSEISIDTSGLDLMGRDEAALDDQQNSLQADAADVEAFTESAFAALQMGDPTETISDFDERTVAITNPTLLEGIRDTMYERGELDEELDLEEVIEATPDQVLAEELMSPELAVDEEDLIAEVDDEILAEESIYDHDALQIQAENERLRANLAALEQEAQQLHEQLDLTQPQIPPDDSELQRLQAEMAQLQEENGQLQARLLQTPSPDIEQENQRLQALIGQLQQQQDAQDEQGANLLEENEQLQSKQRALAQERDDLIRERQRLEQRTSQLEDKVRTLEKAASGATVSSRELLDLREILNRKDREILDFKDTSNSKEKALLEQRERITSLERTIADSEEKLLGLERTRVTLQEQVVELSDDKQLLANKADGLTKRIESIKEELERRKADLDKEREKSRAANEAHREKLQALEERIQVEAAAAQQVALQALHQELERAREQALELLRQEHAQNFQAQEERREADLTEQRLKLEQKLRTREEELLVQAEQEREQIEARHQAELSELTQRHVEELVKIEQVNAAALEERNQAQTQQIQELNQVHETRIEEISQAQAQQIEELNQVHTQQIEEISQTQAQQLQELNQTQSLQIDQLNQIHEALTAEISQSHAQQIQELNQSHAQQIEELQSILKETESIKERSLAELAEKIEFISDLEGEVLQRDQRLGEGEAAQLQLTSDLTQLRKEHENLMQQSGELEAQLARVESWNEHNQRRADAALEKIRSDTEVHAKAKRAMAIALKLIADLPPHLDPVSLTELPDQIE